MRADPSFSDTGYTDRLGRRSAPRLHLSVKGRLVSVVDTQTCTLLDVSQSGARIALDRPLAVDDCGYLRVGSVEAFGTVVRVRKSEDGSGINGVAFETRLTKAQVLALRAYANNYDLAERRESLLEARAWVTGGR